MSHQNGQPSTRRTLIFEIVVNWVLPYLIYDQSKSRWGASETEALIWATIVPGVVVIIGLIRQRKFDVIATTTLLTLVISILIAVGTQEPRLLQLRESYLSAILGGLMILSVLVGRPALVWLAPSLVPPERRLQLEHPSMRTLLTRLTWIWGLVSSSELALKWWMVEHLTIGQVLALGPVAFAVLTGVGVFVSIVVSRSLVSKFKASQGALTGPLVDADRPASNLDQETPKG